MVRLAGDSREVDVIDLLRQLQGFVEQDGHSAVLRAGEGEDIVSECILLYLQDCSDEVGQPLRNWRDGACVRGVVGKKILQRLDWVHGGPRLRPPRARGGRSATESDRGERTLSERVGEFRVPTSRVIRLAGIEPVARESEPASQESPSEPGSYARNPEPRLGSVEDAVRHAAAILEHLTPAQRSARDLREEHDLPLKLVGAKLGISRDAARKRVYAARRRARRAEARRLYWAYILQRAFLLRLRGRRRGWRRLLKMLAAGWCVDRIASELGRTADAVRDMIGRLEAAIRREKPALAWENAPHRRQIGAVARFTALGDGRRECGTRCAEDSACSLRSPRTTEAGFGPATGPPQRPTSVSAASP